MTTNRSKPSRVNKATCPSNLAAYSPINRNRTPLPSPKKRKAKWTHMSPNGAPSRRGGLYTLDGATLWDKGGEVDGEECEEEEKSVTLRGKFFATPPRGRVFGNGRRSP